MKPLTVQENRRCVFNERDYVVLQTTHLDSLDESLPSHRVTAYNKLTAEMNILPVDLIPLVLRQLSSPHDLTLTSRVNRTFLSFSLPILYEKIYVLAWQRQSKLKLMKLFRTLASRKQLALYIRKLEIRDYPKGLTTEENEQLTDTCLCALSHCVNLQSCVWTRDGSLTTPIISTLASCPVIEDLTINGRSNGHYDPQSLTSFSKLKQLTIIMPSPAIITLLPAWFPILRNSLSHLSLICKGSPFMTDEILSECCQSLSALRSLHLIGCTKVTHKGVLDVLWNNKSISSLSLAGLSLHFELVIMRQACLRHELLKALTSITLTVPYSKDDTFPETWMMEVSDLLSNSPLQEFQIYTLGGDLNPHRRLPEIFVSKLLFDHGPRLRKFAIQRLRTSLTAVDMICRGCPRLKQLFIVLHEKDLVKLGLSFGRTASIHTVHISFPPDASLNTEDAQPILKTKEMLYLVKCLGPQLRLFGVSTKVYLIERVLYPDENGQLTLKTQLTPYRSSEIPEQFLIVQT